ncbi:bisphosphoglycerate mutase-like [Tachyglossus aculeatus]|uniref:bisphosphoglycerate mutase-like n=1 Tax=Tachyglossus aculeatus TaxID=9261 RepID=UPI0018F778CF|nr:bisphosphoglycerate mutase-like [Tachyglossus aculeatus]
MSKYKLVMLRHGEGAWKKENRFRSWVDQKLNSDGVREAQNCGKQLGALNFEFDLVFTSVLDRSIHTAWLGLEEMGQEWVPAESSWRLNERHYGTLIGLDGEKMALNQGEEQVRIWRRTYDVTPPPIEESHPYYHEIYNDRRYKCCDASVDKLPRSESLKEVLDRLLPFWTERIAPALKSGKTILISAHGNSSRALLKHLEEGRSHHLPPIHTSDVHSPVGIRTRERGGESRWSGLWGNGVLTDGPDGFRVSGTGRSKIRSSAMDLRRRGKGLY